MNMYNATADSIERAIAESPITIAAKYGDVNYFGPAIVDDEGRIFMLSTGPELDASGNMLKDYYAFGPKNVCDIKVTLEGGRIILWLTLREPLGIEFLM